MGEVNKGVLTTIVILGIILLAGLSIFMLNTSSNYQTDNNNNNYNPYTPPPTPPPRPNVERVDLRGEWSSEKISTGILSSKTIYHYTIRATYYNKGNADATMRLTYRFIYTQNGSERTIQDTQVVQLRAGEVKEFACTLYDVPNSGSSYNCLYEYL
ncbi:MAG: hypothetical protein LBC03_00670 [Nitrososphaerota archaeon]|jgi:hypothetical protein|nr:hypothetical protein [Nitrososphaerota archaeon]